MMYVEADGEVDERQITTKAGAAMVLYSQPAILIQDGERGNVMFELPLESRADALEVGTRYALSVRAFEKGDYGALTLARRFKLKALSTADIRAAKPAS